MTKYNINQWMTIQDTITFLFETFGPSLGPQTRRSLKGQYKHASRNGDYETIQSLVVGLTRLTGFHFKTEQKWDPDWKAYVEYILLSMPIRMIFQVEIGQGDYYERMEVVASTAVQAENYSREYFGDYSASTRVVRIRPIVPGVQSICLI